MFLHLLLKSGDIFPSKKWSNFNYCKRSNKVVNQPLSKVLFKMNWCFQLFKVDFTIVDLLQQWSYIWHNPIVNWTHNYLQANREVNELGYYGYDMVKLKNMSIKNSSMVLLRQICDHVCILHLIYLQKIRNPSFLVVVIRCTTFWMEISK